MDNILNTSSTMVEWVTETGSLILLSRLFTDCIGTYQLVQRVSTAPNEHRIAQTKFDNQELRLTTWGRACGLIDGLVYDTKLDEPAIRKRVVATLTCIKELYTDSESLHRSFGLLKPDAVTSGVLNPETSASSLPLTRTYFGSFYERKQIQSGKRHQETPSFSIVDISKFADLVKHLMDFNDDLEAFTKDTRIPSIQQGFIQYELNQVDEVNILEQVGRASQDESDIVSLLATRQVESIRSELQRTLSIQTRDSDTRSFITARSSFSLVRTMSLMSFGTDHGSIMSLIGQEPEWINDLPVLKRKSRLKDWVLENRIPQFKLLVVGDKAADKTGLLIYFTRGGWPEGYIPTVFESYIAELSLGNKKYDLKLWDISGQEDYDRLRPLSYPGSDVILLCFNVDIATSDAASNLKDMWIPEINHFATGVSVVLVGVHPHHDGGPCEVCDSEDSEERLFRELMATHIGAVQYLFCNLQTGHNVNYVFQVV